MNRGRMDLGVGAAGAGGQAGQARLGDGGQRGAYGQQLPALAGLAGHVEADHAGDGPGTGTVLAQVGAEADGGEQVDGVDADGDGVGVAGDAGQAAPQQQAGGPDDRAQHQFEVGVFGAVAMRFDSPGRGSG